MAIHNTIGRAIQHRHILHKRLKRRLILFPLIAFIMFIVIIVDAILNNVQPLWIIAGGLLGLGVGYLVGLIYKIYWHEDKQKVVSGIDRLSVLLIIVYVAFRIGSEHLIGEFVHGHELTIVTYSILGGILFGRMLGVLHKVDRVLASKSVLDYIKTATPKKRRRRA